MRMLRLFSFTCINYSCIFSISNLHSVLLSHYVYSVMVSVMLLGCFFTHVLRSALTSRTSALGNAPKTIPSKEIKVSNHKNTRDFRILTQLHIRHGENDNAFFILSDKSAKH